MKKKIVIGTAQFGNIYGISNIKKINLNPKEIKKILKFCNENNLIIEKKKVFNKILIITFKYLQKFLYSR